LRRLSSEINEVMGAIITYKRKGCSMNDKSAGKRSRLPAISRQ